MKYDLEYFERMLRNNSRTAEEINSIRWKFISSVKPKRVLDYGSGVGWFRAYRPKGVEVDTYDVGEYPQTGANPEFGRYDLVTFWDSLEHIEDLGEIAPFVRGAKYVALSLPIKPKHTKLEDWKHFKPNEHLHYFDRVTLDALFSRLGFYLIKSGSPECPPREDVFSAIYERRV